MYSTLYLNLPADWKAIRELVAVVLSVDNIVALEKTEGRLPAAHQYNTTIILIRHQDNTTLASKYLAKVLI